MGSYFSTPQQMEGYWRVGFLVKDLLVLLALFVHNVFKLKGNFLDFSIEKTVILKKILFLQGFDPWSSGAAYGGVKEPKHTVTAINGFFVKNNLQTGGWCLGPNDNNIQFNGAFICETKPQNGK